MSWSDFCCGTKTTTCSSSGVVNTNGLVEGMTLAEWVAAKEDAGCTVERIDTPCENHMFNTAGLAWERWALGATSSPTATEPLSFYFSDGIDGNGFNQLTAAPTSAGNTTTNGGQLSSHQSSANNVREALVARGWITPPCDQGSWQLRVVTGAALGTYLAALSQDSAPTSADIVTTGGIEGNQITSATGSVTSSELVANTTEPTAPVGVFLQVGDEGQGINIRVQESFDGGSTWSNVRAARISEDKPSGATIATSDITVTGPAECAYVETFTDSDCNTSENSCNSISLSYSDDNSEVVAICEGEEVARIPTVSCPEFVAQWQVPGNAACQKLVINSITGITPITVEANGSFVTGFPIEVDQPRSGNVILQVTDGNGCQRSEVYTNDIELNQLTWVEPTAITSATNTTAGQVNAAVITPDPAGLFSHITMRATNTTAGAELVQAQTSEQVRMRRGTITDPNQIILESDIDVAIPIQNPLCNPRVEYSVDLRDAGTLEPGDGYRAFLDWYDGTTLLSSVNVTGGDVVDDNPRTVYTGVETPPANANGYKMRVEGWTSVNAEWVLLGLNQGNTWIREVSL